MKKILLTMLAVAFATSFAISQSVDDGIKFIYYQRLKSAKEALQKVLEKYNGNMPSMISIATGPSRTADIEKTLVTGAHGPKEIFVFLVDDSSKS